MDISEIFSALRQGDDLRPLWVVTVAFLAGVSRGFTGFGAGMIFIPVVGALYSPRLAVALLFLVDFIGTTPLLLPHFRNCNWREIAPLLVAAILAFPFGLFFLTRLDPLVVRWGLSIFICTIVAIMATGWRYHGKPTPQAALGIGGACGFFSGAIGLGGPFIVLFWLGGQEQAARVRSNIFSFFGVFSVASGIGYLAQGMLTLDILFAALVLLPIYLVPIFIGSRIFDRSSDAVYRKASLTFCGVIAVATLPVWSRLFA